MPLISRWIITVLGNDKCVFVQHVQEDKTIIIIILFKDLLKVNTLELQYYLMIFLLYYRVPTS